MSTFITLPCVAHTSKDDDFKATVRVDTILAVLDANPRDKKTRIETNALVIMPHGTFATTLNRVSILEMIANAELNAPSPTD